MILPLLLLLFQAPPAPADAKPVRVWLASSGPLVRGQAVPVYVQTARDGELIVLHRRTDGRIEVLFPDQPTVDPFVRKGTYEIRGSGDRPAWVVAEPDGTGMILAALSSDVLRFDEFVRAAAWDSNALAPTWAGSDALGALSDIVQRMLGAGDFNYDFVTYTVAPPVYAQLPDTAPGYGTYPVCTGCTFIGYQEIIIAPGHFGRRRPRLPRDTGICGIHEPCAEANQTHAIALALRPVTPALVPPSPSRIVMPRRRSPGSAVEPIRRRERVPPSGAVAAALSPTRTRAVASAPLRHVRFTALSTPEPAAPRAIVEPPGDARAAVGLRAAVPVGRRRAVAQPMIRSELEPPTATRQRAGGLGAQPAAAASQPAPRAASVAVARGKSAGTTQGMALPRRRR